MARCKVRTEDLRKLAIIYNKEGKRAVYKKLASQYEIKNPYIVMRRMREAIELSYNSEKDVFEIKEQPNPENVFMSMNELCAPIVPQHINVQERDEIDSRPAAMDRLIRELIGDRLLELSKYVKIDSLSKTILIDKTNLVTDGYQLLTH